MASLLITVTLTTLTVELWLKRGSGGAENAERQVTKKVKSQPPKFRQYWEEYVRMGFYIHNLQSTHGIVFFSVGRHWLTVEWSQHISSAISRQNTHIMLVGHLRLSVMRCLCNVSIAKDNKPFTIGEDLLLPAAVVLAERMLDKNAAEKFKTVPLSNDSVCCRVDKMGTDIVEQVVGNLSNYFSLQLDDSTDVSGNAQLVSLVRYVDTDDIYEHILFCKTLEGKTTGEDIFNVVNTFFCENGLSWKSCSSICTDATASMTGKARRLIARIKKENPNVKRAHTLASKKISPELHFFKLHHHQVTAT